MALQCYKKNFIFEENLQGAEIFFSTSEVIFFNLLKSNDSIFEGDSSPGINGKIQKILKPVERLFSSDYTWTPLFG